MAQPTKGELVHATVYKYMQQHLLNRTDTQDMSAKSIKEIAREAAGVAKTSFENNST